MNRRYFQRWLPVFSLIVAFNWMPRASAQDRALGKGRRSEGAPAATPTKSTAPAETGYGLYRMVRLRNVFDPDRRPVAIEGAPRPEAAAQPPRSSFLILTGTMVTENKRLAFFTGSQGDYSKVIGVDGHVADVTVTGISASHVDLQRGGETLVLPVGKQLTLGTTNSVIVSPVAADPPTAPGNSTPANGGTAPPTSGGSTTPASPAANGANGGTPADRAEMMRRMMERRQKENK